MVFGKVGKTSGSRPVVLCFPAYFSFAQVGQAYISPVCSSGECREAFRFLVLFPVAKAVEWHVETPLENESGKDGFC